MNAHRLRSRFNRQHLAPFTFFFLLVVVAATAFVVQSSATAGGGGDQGPPPRQSIEEMKKDFNEDDLKTKDDKPAGKWGFSIHLDSSKINDPSVPAYVRSIQLLSGGGQYRGIHKIKRVRVTNRTSKTIALVQVRVEVFNLKEPEKVLLEEALPFANVSIAPNATEVVEVKTLHPTKLLKALAKGGELNEEFGLRMSVQAVRFADGTFWSEPVPSALLKSPYLDESPDFRFPTLASLAARITAPFRSPDTKRADTTRCAPEPRLAASAFLSVPFEYETCTDNSAARFDATGRQNCGTPSTNACYAHCSDDGWCNTWKDTKPCSGPTPTPTPTPSPSPSPGCSPPEPPHPCCTPEEVTFLNTTSCRWNCKPPHCETGTPFANGCYSVDGPVVCDDGYEFTTSGPSGGLLPGHPDADSDPEAST